MAHDTFLKWLDADRANGRTLLEALWRDGSDPVDALATFLEALPKEVVGTPGNRASIGSVLLMASDPTMYPPYRPTPLQRAYAMVGAPPEPDDPVERYRRALAFFDDLVARAGDVGLQLRDRLDAQAVTGSSHRATSHPTTGGSPTGPASPGSEARARALARARAQRTATRTSRSTHANTTARAGRRSRPRTRLHSGAFAAA
jgi:hypothetical protein